jgi:nucleoside-diphosphate-sugar epimerase
VYHFAAPPVLSDIRSVQLGLPLADAHATANLLDACHDAGVVRLVFASSTSVYRPRPGPHCETGLLKPRTVHGWTKLASEQMCLAHGIPPDATMSVVALRYNNVYGPRQNPMELIPRILAAVHTGAPVDLFGTPAGPPQFLHVFDAVRAALTAAAAPIREAAVNIAGLQTITVAQLIGLVRHLTGITVHVAPGYPPPDVAADTVDLSEAGRVLGFNPLVGLDEGLHGYLDCINSSDSAPPWPYRVTPQMAAPDASLSRVIPPGWSKR